MSSSDPSRPLLGGAEGFGNYSTIGSRDGVRSDNDRANGSFDGFDSSNDTHAPYVGPSYGSVAGVGPDAGAGVG